ncbi:O-succinylhomoserine sulfhydrylase [Tsukamurella strandjordii]|uniref:O-succinylhomoserine sulfhydrylase n=1 Tax=Tsukamurella strandjordii TaxID=147577 RepID=A0AA90SFS0_9ACTN|nr:O-succinylhomoserine sulfhydrylase [Tsukamurella strandjordii]MDP0396894.1 O-succinylhomoserine sulfhydrylase [Tsukamurella strandjordii]
MEFNHLPDGVRSETLGVRGGLLRSNYEETSEALYLNSGYTYESAEAAEAAFNGDIDRFVYSRYGNPTVAMFQERLRLLEGAEACFATASGMSAVFTALGALLQAGDRLVAARSLFGSCYVVCNEILPRWGIETEFVDGEDLAQWEAALSKPAQAVFFETPANPMQGLVDVRAVSDLAHAAGAQVVLDAGFTPVGYQDCFGLGADVIVHSSTKSMDGQGRVMGGAILGTFDYIDGPVKQLMRHTGPAMAPFNAWVLVKALETLDLRAERISGNAQKVAEFLDADPRVSKVIYPFLPSHPQYELAKRQMKAGGTVITLELADGDLVGKDRAFQFLNRLQVIDISNNFGDAKSLITHPATTTHRATGPEGRAKIGLTDSMLRLSVGLENVDDLIADLDRALG